MIKSREFQRLCTVKRLASQIGNCLCTGVYIMPNNMIMGKGADWKKKIKKGAEGGGVKKAKKSRKTG